ncbi:MAG: hypothetical protein QUT30_08045 [Acidobacteriota bacterium]|nr:hypothetical protein [Acidobacteriota bacterium]
MSLLIDGSKDLHAIFSAWAAAGLNAHDERLLAPVTDWKYVESFLRPLSGLLQANQLEIDSLLGRSNRELSPLHDPLRLDFTTNRWFAAQREENYSDWLAWILQNLPVTETETLFRILDIEDPSLLDRVSEKPQILREPHVDEGHPGSEGRVDMLVLYQACRILIHVEVKVVNAEAADLGKNENYVRSLIKRYGIEDPVNRLLVTGGEKSFYGDGHFTFKRLDWEHVCLNIRRAAKDIWIKKNELLVASLALSFVGAVEQILLQHSCNRPYVAERTIQYLAKTIKS